MSFIYLDNNATTKLDSEVLQEMLPYLETNYGNASSLQHALGRASNLALTRVRQQLSTALQVTEKELFFNSGATEAINTVLKGIYSNYSRKGRHIITCTTEHKAVLSACEALEKVGAEISYLGVDRNGQIDLAELTAAIRPDTILVSIMAANNETGVCHPLAEIAQICQQNEVLYFCDATQLIGKAKINLQEIPIDMLCFSAHKFHGPQGVGALFVRRKRKPIQIAPLIHGGSQEGGFRGGTYPVAALVGMGKALAIAKEHPEIEILRNYLEQELIKQIPETYIHAADVARLGNTSNIHFKHVLGAALMTKLPQVAIAAGSACISGDRDPSHVLLAMHCSAEEALCSLRFSLSKYTTKTEIDQALIAIRQAVAKIRAESPIWKLYQAGMID